MALRVMPSIHVVRPSDANETLNLVEHYLADKKPVVTALILSRQDMPVLGADDAKASAAGARNGGYVLRERDDAVFTLVATGSEVAHCLKAQEDLLAKGISTRVVALPCWTCFEEQSADHKKSVLRRSIPSVSLEAGATLGWTKYVDEAIGIDTFGISAPGSYVFDYFNINAQTVVSHVERVLGEKK